MTEEQKQAYLDYVDELKDVWQMDRPLTTQYWVWITRLITKGDLGFSMVYQRSVGALIRENITLTVTISAVALVVTMGIGVVVGVYSATHQYSLFDRVATIIGFAGLGIPNFVLILVLMFIMVFAFDVKSVGGYVSAEYAAAPWSWARLWDVIKHLWIPIAVAGVTSTAGTIRTIRANLLDVLQLPYVQTARSKGLAERVVVYRHALRNSLHPFIMGIGGILVSLISGGAISGIVLGLPTVGLIYYNGLSQQDSALAASVLLIFSLMLQLGNLLADLVLVWVDPTVSYEA
jgi:peptide/nickel transport system permease protein